MNINNFNKIINEILDNKQIEGIKLNNINLLKNIIFDNEINNKLFDSFKKDYNITYGDDPDYLIMKTQDCIYRISLLINNCLIANYGIAFNNEIKDIISQALENNTFSLFDSVSYDNSDYEIINEYNEELEELLSKKRI